MIIHTNAKSESKMRIIDLTSKIGSNNKPLLLAGGLIILTVLVSAATFNNNGKRFICSGK